MKKKIFMAVAMFFTMAAFAQDSTKILNEVVVTATKYPIKQSLTGKVLTVITLEQLQQNSGKSLSEVLNTQVGLIVNGTANTYGTVQDVYVRGASTGKTLILIDGIPAYDVSSISTAYDVNLIAVDQVERIEILKGSQSTLYGSDAVAGVINIITKKGGDKKLGVTANISAGSFNTFKESISLNGTANKTNYNVQFTQLNSKGFSSAYDEAGNKNFDKDGMGQSALIANLNQKVNDKLALRFTAQLSKYTIDLDASQFKDDKDFTSTSKNNLVGIGADYSINKTKVHFNYKFSKVQRKYIDDSASVGGFAKYTRSEYNGSTHFTELYANIAASNKVDVLAGVEYRMQQTDYEYFSLSSFGPYKDAIGDSAKVSQLGAYASVVIKDINGFNFEAGLRYNNFNKYGDAVTFSVNPSYIINKNVKLFANVSSGFKAPSLYQIYSEYRNPNTELKPEKSINYEAGLQYNKGNKNLRAVYFIRNLNDVIAFYTSPSWVSYYVNADKQKDKGFELEAAFTLDKVTFTANYINVDGFIETKTGNKDTSFFNLYRRPAQTINLNAGFDVCKNWKINIGVQTVSKRFEYVFGAAPIEMPAYYVWNAYSSYTVNKKVTLFADFKNITNEKYFEVRGYNTRRFNFMAGITVKL